jgi:hypothetical protein
MKTKTKLAGGHMFLSYIRRASLLVAFLVCQSAAESQAADADMSGYLESRVKVKSEPEPEVINPASQKVIIGVMEFASKGGISQERADVIADMIAKEIGRTKGVQVLGMSEILSMLNHEQRKRLAGCTTSKCLSQISSALSMSWAVTGNICSFGNSYVLTLKLLNVRKAFVVGRVSLRIKGDEEDLLEGLVDKLPETIRGLHDQLTMFTTRSEKQAKRVNISQEVRP